MSNPQENNLSSMRFALKNLLEVQPSAKQAQEDAPKPSTDKRRASERKRALSDLYYFTKYILGKDLLDPIAHGPLCRFLSTWKQNAQLPTKIVLQPRGTFKSTVCTVAYPLWRYLRNPDIRILIASFDLALAEAFLAEIKQHIETNEKLKYIFGDLYAAATRWNEREIGLPRTRATKEQTITVGAVGRTQTGPHYDLMIFDDLVNNRNAQSPTLRQDVINFLHDVQPMREVQPPGQMLLVGTRWYDEDAYGWFLGEAEKGAIKDCEVWLRRADEIYCPKCDRRLDWPPLPESATTGVCPDCNVQGQTVRYFPSRLTDEYLASQRAHLGSEYRYNCQYQNDPRGDQSTDFNRSMFKRWVHPPAPKENIQSELPATLNIYAAIDMAFTAKKDSDYTAIVVLGASHTGDYYVLYAVQKRIELPEIISWIAEVDMQYRPLMFAIETFTAQHVIYDVMRQELRRWVDGDPARRRMPNLVPITRSSFSYNASKIDRIRARLLPLYAAGRMWHPYDSRVLEEQLLRFPHTRHDDLVDALAIVFELPITTPTEPARDYPPGSWMATYREFYGKGKGPNLIRPQMPAPRGTLQNPNKVVYPEIKPNATSV